ncbi:MAG: PorP/SprF family type IX secretion system membrane protein [Allomuricauda sp.]
MRRLSACLLFVLTTVVALAQERTLPMDFRQHSLTQFNASLLNATYAFDWNHPNALSVWTRWQWQTIDGDPTTIFANYTHQINAKSAFALGFLQHNTGTFLDVGANADYVHVFHLDGNVKFMVGVNIFAFQEKLADDRFISDPDVELPQLESPDSFILQFSPAIRLQVNRFSVGLAFENAVGVNLSGNDSGDTENFKIVTGTLSNDFPLVLFKGWEDSFVRPVVYVKSVPEGDTQFGVNGLLSTPRIWVQGGYNSFYGASGGLGVTFAKVFSVGGLMEFGTDSPISDEESTLELLASYHFGKSDNRKKVVDFDAEADDALARERMRAEEEQQRQQELLDAEKAAQEAAQQEILLKKQEREKDSIAQALVEAQRMAEQKRLDSIAALQKEKVELKPNERYEEVTGEDGLTPGFYLIANVFGTKKYYENFMLTLKRNGLEPKSFYRKKNNYNYVYLERYNTMDEARKARDSKFFGKYDGKTWIFRARNE